VFPKIIFEEKAELESTKVFTQNLYNLLLTPPIKGKTVLALDPGYTNGCKMALINPTGNCGNWFK